MAEERSNRYSKRASPYSAVYDVDLNDSQRNNDRSFAESHHEIPDAPPAPYLRRWRHSVLNCCGDCGEDCAACSFACHCPCFAYGLNNKRGLNRSFVKNLMFFFIFGFLFYYVGIIGGVVAILRWCPEVEVARDLGTLNYTDYNGSCREAIKINYLIRLVAIPAYIILVVIAAKRRGHIREKFGIPGSCCGDCCTWFWCSSCALAQETRTLMHNNVFGGHWLGPVDAATLRVQEAERFLPPQPVGGMV